MQGCLNFLQLEKYLDYKFSQENGNESNVNIKIN